MPARRPPSVRFWEKVDKGGDCWLWTASVDMAGYGQFGVTEGVIVKAYRWAWEQENGPVPAGMQLDHLCRERRCVRPSHLEPVTQRENLLRGDGPSARAARATECPKGHPYDEANTRLNSRGHRVCVICSRARQRVNPERSMVPTVTPETVAAIRSRYAAGGGTYRQLADEFGVHHMTVGRIIRGERH
jgi:hypothetical protein